MRNILGAEAKVKFTEAILVALKTRSITPKIAYSKTDVQKIQEVSWAGRILFFDRKPKVIGKNVDAILLTQPDQSVPLTGWLGSKNNYLVCGEIKGGIDPAGADEHWKTAYGALDRIREKFPEKRPKLFFVAAAIENSMAEEIFSQLKSGLLNHAANLNMSQQLSDLASWLVSF